MNLNRNKIILRDQNQVKMVRNIGRQWQTKTKNGLRWCLERLLLCLGDVLEMVRHFATARALELQVPPHHARRSSLRYSSQECFVIATTMNLDQNDAIVL